MDFQELEKIKDRIAKLLKMAADASSPNEAAIAAQRARALMDKHQLDEFDVGNRMEEEFADEPATRFYASIPQYLSVFSVVCAKYNDCQARFEYGKVTHKKNANRDYLASGKRVVFLGYKSDVQLCKQMFDYLCETVNRLCKEFMNSRGLTSYSVRVGGQFKIGAFQAISSRIEQMTIQRDAITFSNGNALVLVKKAGVDAKFGEAGYSDVKLKRPDEDDPLELEARSDGWIQGSKVEIVKSLEKEDEDENPEEVLRLS